MESTMYRFILFSCVCLCSSNALAQTKHTPFPGDITTHLLTHHNLDVSGIPEKDKLQLHDKLTQVRECNNGVCLLKIRSCDMPEETPSTFLFSPPGKEVCVGPNCKQYNYSPIQYRYRTRRK